jgi:hypothetical protein
MGKGNVLVPVLVYLAYSISSTVDPAAALSLLETQKQAKKQLESEKRSAMKSMTDMKKRLESFKAAKEQPDNRARGRDLDKRYRYR